MGYTEWVPVQQEDGQNACAALRGRMMIECWSSVDVRGRKTACHERKSRRRDYLQDGGRGRKGELLSRGSSKKAG